jgi:hypothetical protein
MNKYIFFASVVLVLVSGRKGVWGVRRGGERESPKSNENVDFEECIEESRLTSRMTFA